ncbi:MAG: hypothetical protein ACM3X0_11060 [Bacteroidota bacterium]
MNVNPWVAPKSRAIRKVLVALAPQVADACDVVPDAGNDPQIVTLRHTELNQLCAHIYLHGQRAGTYGIFFEYPHPVPGILESKENLSLSRLLESLALHFDA